MQDATRITVDSENNVILVTSPARGEALATAIGRHCGVAWAEHYDGRVKVQARSRVQLYRVRDAVKAEIERQAAAPRRSTSTSTSTGGRHDRRMVAAGSVRIGDALGGRIVTGLGRSWTIDEDACVYGFSPCTRVQYAYLGDAAPDAPTTPTTSVAPDAPVEPIEAPRSPRSPREAAEAGLPPFSGGSTDEAEVDIEQLALVCADECVEAAGADPIDVDGRCLLPTEPLPGDLEALEAELGRAPTDAELAVFVETYAGRMERHRALVQHPLRRHRTRLGMTQGELATAAGTSQPYVSRLERGDSSPTIEMVVKLATALGCRASELAAELGWYAEHGHVRYGEDGLVVVDVEAFSVVWVDYSVGPEEWWDAAHAAEDVPPAARTLISTGGDDEITVSHAEAHEIMAWARTLPGWQDDSPIKVRW